MLNEYGEKIEEKEVKEISRRISNLSIEDVDKLFYNLDFIVKRYNGKDRPNKFSALFPKQIKEIKEVEKKSSVVEDLLLESHFKEVKKELERIEK